MNQEEEEERIAYWKTKAEKYYKHKNLLLGKEELTYLIEGKAKRMREIEKNTNTPLVKEKLIHYRIKKYAELSKKARQELLNLQKLNSLLTPS